MNDLPKSVRDRLADAKTPRSAAPPDAGEVGSLSHPDPDQLTAFNEGSLTAAERQQVLAHLSTCTDCREIVFLSAPPQEPTTATVALRPARRRWFRWAAPVGAVAAVSIAVGLYLELRPRAPELPAKPPITTATNTSGEQYLYSPTLDSKSSAPAAQEPDLRTFKKQSSPTRSGLAKSEAALQDQLRKPAAETPSNETQHYTAPAPAIAELQAPAAPKQQSLAKTESQQTIEVTAAAAPAAAMRTQVAVPPPAESATSATKSAGELKQKLAAADTTAEVAAPSSGFTLNRAARSPALRPQWRVSDAGAIERAYNPGQWQTALQRPNTEFRVVSVVGTHVWAGAANGEIFHSADFGNSWKPVKVEHSGQHLTGAVTSIVFSDDRTGSIQTATGEFWSTTDGGKHWSKK